MFTYEHYKYILKTAISNGYRFISFAKAESGAISKRACLLRHDCDNDLVAASNMAAIEAKLGVRSTYFLMLRSAMYNLLTPNNLGLVRDILSHGHWLGLHFDCDGSARSKTDYAKEIIREREWLSFEMDTRIDVVSFHQPSKEILQGDLGLDCINTYDLKANDFFYLSDSNLSWREDCPSDVFKAKRYPRVQLLIHPEWWTEREISLTKKWHQMLRHNFALTQSSLLNRENTYNETQQLIFRKKAKSND